MIPRQFALDVLAINRAIASAEDHEEVLRLVVDRTAAFTGAAACLLLLAQADGLARVVRSVGVDPAKAAQLAVPLTERIDAELCSLFGFQGRDRFIGVPVIGNEGLTGILAVCWDAPRAGGAVDAELISAFADQAAIALANIDRVRRLHAAAEDLRKSRERFRELVETTSDWLWEVDENGVYTYASPRVRQLLGYEPEEVLGRTPFDLMPPGEARRVAEAFAAIAAERRPFASLENTNRHKDGHLVVLETSGIPLFDAAGTFHGYRGIDRDVTERERVRQALHESEAKLAGIISTAADAIVSVDEAQCIVLYNEAAHTIFGWSKEEVLGKPIGVLIPERFRAAHAQHVRGFGASREMARKASAQRRAFFGLRKNGEEFPAEVAISKVSIGAAWQFTAVLRDITERKRAEEALQASEASLAEANRKKDEFLAMLAHELRNPLAPMRLAAENISTVGSADGIVELGAAVIGRQVTHLSRLVDDLLDVSRIRHGMIEVRKRRTALADVVGAAVETSRPSIEEREQRLAVVQEHPEIYLDGDADRLAQVLCNLLNNAAKFTPKGGEITLTTRIEGDGAVVSVRDSGRGIPADLLPRVFELFFQAEPGGGRGCGGMGIGLALARRLVELHGGTLEASSDGEGKGSEFVVRLPRQAEAPGPHAVPPAAAEPGAAASYRVLVVDDNVDAAKMTQVFLQARGHDVRCAFDGSSALGLAREFEPQLVLLDIAMPGMDGYEVLSRLREQPGTRQAVVAAVTGYASEAGRERLKQLGLNHYLVKPAAPQALLALIASLAAPQDIRTA